MYWVYLVYALAVVILLFGLSWAIASIAPYLALMFVGWLVIMYFRLVNKTKRDLKAEYEQQLKDKE